MVNIFDYVRHMVSVATVQSCCDRTKAAIDNAYRNVYGCVSIKLYLQEHMAG